MNNHKQPFNLVLVRHGQSEWNALNLFTGWRDVELSAQGRAEAQKAGQAIRARGLTFDQAFTSDLKRAQDTLAILLRETGQEGAVPVVRSAALNERNYGDLNGMNKDEARAKFGADQVHIWRRSYDVPPPGGESLKDTEDRAWPYFVTAVLPLIQAGKKVIISAHGNSLRALVKRLDGLTPEEIIEVEIPTGSPMYYALDENGAVLDKKMSAA